MIPASATLQGVCEQFMRYKIKSYLKNNVLHTNIMIQNK